MKTLFLKLFVTFLSLTALVAICAILGGGFEEFQRKVLATTFSISVASVASMSCVAFINKKNQKGVGTIGIILSCLSATLIILALFLEINDKEYWKVTITFIVFASTLAQGCLLNLPDIDASYRWVQKTSSVSVSVLALQIVTAVWCEIDSEEYYKFLGAVSIVVVLQLLVIPILLKVSKGERALAKTLKLTQNKDGTFCDQFGCLYEVTKLESKL